MPVYEYNASSNKLNLVAGATLYADAPIGSIQAYGGTTAPSGWLLCQGQKVSRTTYADLFAAIGTAFGTGDGSTTFNVPDLRESAPVGVGENGTQTIAAHDVYTLGEFKDDQFQGHAHDKGAFAGADYTNGGAWKTIPGVRPTGSPVSDGTHGTPRIGTTTHGKQLGVNYIIKAKQASVPFDVAEYVRKWNSPDWDNAIDVITYVQDEAGPKTYTAIDDGFIAGTISARYTSGTKVFVNDIAIGGVIGINNDIEGNGGVFAKVNKDDVIKITVGNAGSMGIAIKFVPHK